MAAYFAPELAALEHMAQSGPAQIERGAIQVTTAGWFLVRAVVMVFDRHLQPDKERHRFSRAG